MTNFVYDDGNGNLTNENGEEHHDFAMEVDDEAYPLGNVTDFAMYTDLKPPEKAAKVVAMKAESSTNIDRDVDGISKKAYRKYNPEDKSNFFFLIYEKNMSVRGAAKELGIPPTTAQSWFSKGEASLEENSEVAVERGVGRKQKLGRPAILNDVHKERLIEAIDERPEMVLDEMMECLTSSFGDLKISKTALYDFVTAKCNLSFKRAKFHSVERNSPEKIEARYQWVKRWAETDMDYMSNCIFIDESAFHINLKRSYGWSKKGEPAIVTVPKTRAKTTTILGAVSAHGVINIKIKQPKVAEPSKKRKLPGKSSANVNKGKGGTVTGHYFNFIASTLDILDRYEIFKDNYIVMDNAPIHTHQDIQKYIESRGYGCVYLPPYSPALNPIEEFWAVCKSKVKREKLLKEETLTSRITDACNNVLLSDLKGF